MSPLRPSYLQPSQHSKLTFSLSLRSQGRFVYGGGIGFAMHAAPIYIAETAPSVVRGTLISLKARWFPWSSRLISHHDYALLVALTGHLSLSQGMYGNEVVWSRDVLFPS